MCWNQPSGLLDAISVPEAPAAGRHLVAEAVARRSCAGQAARSVPKARITILTLFDICATMSSIEGMQVAILKSCCSTKGASPSMPAAGLEDAARVFRALADETRLAILKQLSEQGEVCACDFLGCCQLAQPTVSHHLRVLREAGLVNAVKRGLWVHYTLNRERLAAVRELLS